jgi:hypothetical protein
MQAGVVNCNVLIAVCCALSARAQRSADSKHYAAGLPLQRPAHSKNAHTGLLEQVIARQRGSHNSDFGHRQLRFMPPWPF